MVEPSIKIRISCFSFFLGYHIEFKPSKYVESCFIVEKHCVFEFNSMGMWICG